MGFWEKLPSRRAAAGFVVSLALLAGILIGTLVTTSVEADRSPAARDASLLRVPEPVPLPSQFTELVQKIEPAVVYITTDYRVPASQAGAGEGERQPAPDDLDLFRRFFGDELPRQFRQQASGSGFIVDPKGYIITNYHVIEDADRIKVKLVDDQTEHEAELVGFDVETDLAVIKIDAGRPLKAAEIGNSDAVRVGDWVVAIGSPFGLEASVTAGIVSAKGRDIIGAQQFQRFIQTDAAINPGNSGGPLLNIRGQVIGVNTMIATRTGGYQGIGFALPINTAVKVYNMIIQHGRVQRGSIGIRFGRQDNPDLLRAFGVDHGVVVSGVEPDGPAARAGLKPEDVILAIDGIPVKNGDDLVARVAETEIGKRITLTVDRAGRKLEFPVVVQDRAKVFANDPRFAFAPKPEPRRRQDSEKARFGMYVRNITEREREELQLEDAQGVLVTRVEFGSLADDMGLRERDLIVSINRQPVKSVEDVQRFQAALRPGDAVAFRVLRPFPRPGRARGIRWESVLVAGRIPSH